MSGKGSCVLGIALLGFAASVHADLDQTAAERVVPGISSDCYNSKLYTVGTVVESVYKTTSPAGSLTVKSKSTVKGRKKFNGVLANEVLSNVVATGIAPSTSSQKTYFVGNNTQKTELFYGSIITISQPAYLVGTTTLTLKPALQDRYKLNMNQSYTQNYQSKVTTSVLGHNVNTTLSSNYTKKFVGVETVKVPAGTFQTCRYEETSKETSQNSVATTKTTRWVAKGSGLEVKSKSGNSTSVLISAKINNKKI